MPTSLSKLKKKSLNYTLEMGDFYLKVVKKEKQPGLGKNIHKNKK